MYIVTLCMDFTCIAVNFVYELATEDAVTSSGKFQLEIIQYAICMNMQEPSKQ